jgi:hypothetical protein
MSEEEKEIGLWCQDCEKNHPDKHKVFKSEAERCGHCLWITIRMLNNMPPVKKPYWYWNAVEETKWEKEVRAIREKEFEDICDCVIAPTNSAEDNRITKHSKNKDFIKNLFLDGRDLIPDADCKKCNGTGKKLQKEK